MSPNPSVENQVMCRYSNGDSLQKLAMQGVYGAITGPAGAIWPYRFVTNIFYHLLTQYRHRINIETCTPVLSIEMNEVPSEFPYSVTTSRGTIAARHIVHATNGHVAHLLPRMRGRIFPLRGQMTVQRMDDATVPNLGNERSWILRHGKGFDYMTQNGVSKEFFLGGGIFQGGNGGLDDIGNPADDEENFLSRCHLRGIMAALFEPDSSGGRISSKREDGLGQPKLQSSWTGTMGFSSDGLPWVGKLPSSISERRPRGKDQAPDCGEWIAAGFCGSGMVYCWLSGKALASMIMNNRTDWFPKDLLPTAERYRRASPEGIAVQFATMSL
jgi:glycine/D-amino acid oxidase-like deaminating enzyme